VKSRSHHFLNIKSFIKGVVIGRRKSVGQIGLWSQCSVAQLEEKQSCSGCSADLKICLALAAGMAGVLSGEYEALG